MAGILKLIAAFVAATVLHWVFVTAFAYAGVQPNVMLVFTAAFCALLKPPYGYTAAFLCGLFLDFFGTKVFGNNAFMFSLSAWAVYFLGDRFDFESVFPQMMSVFGLSLFVALGNLLLVHLFASAAVWPGVWSLLGGALVNALLAPAVFAVLRKVFFKGFLCKES